MKTMRNALDVVPYLLGRAMESRNSLITPLKLQKLLYYAQAWSLVFRGEMLFAEDIQAWVHGPVVPSVYQKYKGYGYTTLPQETSSASLESEEIEVLDVVWSTYGSRSAKFLEALTHIEEPWQKARMGLLSTQVSNKTISPQDMKNYYSLFVDGLKPPKINPKALAIKKSGSANFQNNVLAGISSVLEIFPSSQVSFRYYSPSDFSDPSSDFESLTSDWESVGEDLHMGIKMMGEQTETSHD